MVAHWETFCSDDKSAPTRRWEVARDPSGRIVAKRIVSGSTLGKFDGTTTTVYVFEYDKSGRKRHTIQYTQHPNGAYEHDEGWSTADKTIDGKPAWEIDQYYTGEEKK